MTLFFGRQHRHPCLWVDQPVSSQPKKTPLAVKRDDFKITLYLVPDFVRAVPGGPLSGALHLAVLPHLPRQDPEDVHCVIAGVWEGSEELSVERRPVGQIPEGHGEVAKHYTVTHTLHNYTWITLGDITRYTWITPEITSHVIFFAKVSPVY